MKIKESLGLKIREIRKKQGLSQEKFSELIDMNPRQIVRIENGESFPTAENLEKIVATLGVNAKSLFEDDCEESSEDIKSSLQQMITKLSDKQIKFLYLMVSHLY